MKKKLVLLILILSFGSTMVNAQAITYDMFPENGTVTTHVPFSGFVQLDENVNPSEFFLGKVNLTEFEFTQVAEPYEVRFDVYQADNLAIGKTINYNGAFGLDSAAIAYVMYSNGALLEFITVFHSDGEFEFGTEQETLFTLDMEVGDQIDSGTNTTRTIIGEAEVQTPAGVYENLFVVEEVKTDPFGERYTFYFYRENLVDPVCRAIQVQIGKNNFVFSENQTERSTVTDVEEAENMQQLLVYPNPAINTLYIPTSERQTCDIYSSQGSLVQSLILNEGVNKISIEELANGVYYIKTSNLTGSFMKQ